MKRLSFPAAAWVVFTFLSCLGPAIAAEFSGGPYLRLRHEYWKNVFDMNNAAGDDRNFYRIKTSLWGKAAFDGGTTLFARLTNENKPYVAFSGGDARFNIGEVVIDNLYVEQKGLFGAPVDLRIGRQDFLGAYGEGFLIMDGTPQDGSRTFYFNAVKASWQIDPRNSLDGLLIRSPRYDQLPVMNEIPGKQLLNSTAETAYGLYHKSAPSAALRWENYYIWKNEKGGGPALTAHETTLNTFGSFASYAPAALSPVSLRGQLAYQTGTYGPNDRHGLGGYAFADIALKETSWMPAVSAGYVYLSGDDPSTPGLEAWDPLFSRWPWMSELYVLNYAAESGMGYWTNLKMWRASLAFTPLDKLKVSAWYNLLRADHAAAGADRGNLLQGRIDYAFSSQIAAYLLADYFQPGDFYAGQDAALFVRTEIQFKFDGWTTGR